MGAEIGRLSSLKQAYKQAWSDLEDAIDDALHEFGEPTADYPAPVANAVRILRSANENVRARLEANR